MGTSASFALVMIRFPEHRKSIKYLYGRSESFQSLCMDYRDCLNAIEKYSCSAEEHMHSFRQEWQQLKDDLEEEIIWYIQNIGIITFY